jgi:hypothetical protein
MVSLRRLQANKANAQRSTGPRTIVGLKTSAQNALRHGFSSVSTVVVEGVEDPAAYEQFLAQMIEDLDAQGAVETALAERVAQIFWRLWRVTRFETESLSQWQANLLPDQTQLAHHVAALDKAERMTGALSVLFSSGEHEVDAETVGTIREALLGYVGERAAVLAQAASQPLAGFMADALPGERYTVRMLRAALLDAERLLQREPSALDRALAENLVARLYRHWAGAGREWRLALKDTDRSRAAQRTAALMIQLDRMAVVERYEPRLRRDLSRTLADLHSLQDRRRARDWGGASNRAFLPNEPIALGGN